MDAGGSHYWARFSTANGRRLRFDTRIYLHPRPAPRDSDPALGCIIGKNPGSAGPGRSGRSLVPIALDGDKFLPTILSILRKAHAAGGSEAPREAFVQVLNLFYLCDRDLATAKKSQRDITKPRICDTESASYPWAWFAWGGSDFTLDPLKVRFEHMDAERRFFFDGRKRKVVERRPGNAELAKHTQGLPQAALITYLAEFL